MWVWVGRRTNRSEILDNSNHDILAYSEGNIDICALNVKVSEPVQGKQRLLWLKSVNDLMRIHVHKHVSSLRAELMRALSLLWVPLSAQGLSLFRFISVYPFELDVWVAPWLPKSFTKSTFSCFLSLALPPVSSLSHSMFSLCVLKFQVTSRYTPSIWIEVESRLSRGGPCRIWLPTVWLVVDTRTEKDGVIGKLMVKQKEEGSMF